MHEWLSGGVSPCQGEGRGFESRLALLSKEGRKDLLFLCFLPLASNFFCDIITDAKNGLTFCLILTLRGFYETLISFFIT